MVIPLFLISQSTSIENNTNLISKKIPRAFAEGFFLSEFLQIIPIYKYILFYMVILYSWIQKHT